MASIDCKTEMLLDTPVSNREPVEFYNRLYPKTEAVQKLLLQLKQSPRESLLRRDDLLFQLMVTLLREQQVFRESALNLPSLKKSTREEILKRLFRATDYVYAHYNKAISLDELAGISCLSKFHFLRLFKQFFGETPHQFVSRIRIEKGKSLLRQPVSIKSVADEVGFQDASSFSRSFYRQIGVYPETFRNLDAR
jgi:AraC family transcriptional regulator